MKLILKSLLITIGILASIAGVLSVCIFVILVSKWSGPILCCLLVFWGVFATIYSNAKDRESK